MDTHTGGDDLPRSISSTMQPHLLVAEDATRAQLAEAEQLAERLAAAKTAVDTVAAQAAVNTSFAEFEDLPQQSEDTPRRRMTARKTSLASRTSRRTIPGSESTPHRQVQRS